VFKPATLTKHIMQRFRAKQYEELAQDLALYKVEIKPYLLTIRETSMSSTPAAITSATTNTSEGGRL
jgi:hypothetical protein